MLEATLRKAEIQRVYRRLDSHYDLWGALAESRARRRCLELAGIKNGESVLEVAVGTGLVFAEILKLNPQGRTEGIALTEEMLERAKTRAEQLGASHYALKTGDAYDLEYPDNSFDVVLNNYMFDLIPKKDFSRILSEFKRVLRNGGRLVLANMTIGKRWPNRIWELLYRINPALVGGCRGVELKPHVEAAGFTSTKREYISQFKFPTEVICAIKPETGA